MAGWNPWLWPKPEHVHPDFWVGDPWARRDFREWALRKYGSLEKLNAAWHVEFASAEGIGYPNLESPPSRRCLVDFVNWTYDSMTDFTVRILEIAKREFPDCLIAPKLGCGDENPWWGQDNSAIPERAARIRVGIRSTHGASPYFAVRRLASACRFYGAPFETETAGGTNRRDCGMKFFYDASCGCREVFEYPNAILAVGDQFSSLRRHLRGEHSMTDIALFFPTSDHRSRIGQGYPERLVGAASWIRNLLDYDVVDENMILDGALREYRVLVFYDGQVLEEAVARKTHRWVESGGLLFLSRYLFPFENVDEQEIEWLNELALPQIPAEELEFGDELVEWSRENAFTPVGRGGVLVSPWPADQAGKGFELLRVAAYRASGLRGRFRDLPNVDNIWDGVATSLFENRLLFFNANEQAATVELEIEPDNLKRLGVDFQEEFLSLRVGVPARGVAVHFLDRPMVEFHLECEDFLCDVEAEERYVPRLHWGLPGKALRINRRARLSKRFKVPATARYAIYVGVEVETGEPGSLLVDGRRVGEITGFAGPVCGAAPVPLSQGG
jgi:hypothetical protein